MDYKKISVLDCFLDDVDVEQAYREIIQKYGAESNANTPPGLINPINDLSRCTPYEKMIVEVRNKRVLNQAVMKLHRNDGSDQSANETGIYLATTPQVVSPNQIAIAQQIRSIITGKPDVVKPSSANAYELMQKFLSSVPLRRFEGRFYLYSDGIYRYVSSDEVQELISFYLEYEIAGGRGPQIISEVSRMLSSYYAIKAVAVTDSSARFFFRNGAFNLETGLLEPVRLTDFFLTYVNCDFPTSDYSCPVFDSFLSTVSRGDGIIEQAIWEMIGYLLVPYDLNGKVFFVLQGIGNSGKSVLGSLISNFFNPEAVSNLSIFRFKDRFSTSSLVGKRLNVSMDLPKEKLSREAIGTIKMVTGNDVITVEEKYKEAKSYKPTCKLLFGTNFPLLVADNDEAFQQRMVVIPFQYPVPEEAQDKGLLDKLMMERPAIAAKALRAYRNLVQRNYDFVRPGRAVVYGCPPLGETLFRFLEQCCALDMNAYTPTADLHTAFNDFCARAGLPGIDDTAQFSRQLNELCCGRTKPHKRRVNGPSLNCLDGIALLDGNT